MTGAPGRTALACPFERAQLVRCASCRLARTSLLAEREAIGCTSAPASERCRALYVAMRASARFALRADGVTTWTVALELRLQCGGLQGLARALAGPAPAEPDVAGPPATDDGARGADPCAGPDPIEIDGLLMAALARHGAIADLPYDRIMRGIVAYRPRRRPTR